MMIDPREFRRTYPTFLAALVLACALLALAGRDELVVCLAICGCVTELVRGAWSALIEPIAPLFRALSLLAVALASGLLLAASIHAIEGDIPTAALALAAAVLARGLGPARFSAAPARA